MAEVTDSYAQHAITTANTTTSSLDETTSDAFAPPIRYASGQGAAGTSVDIGNGIKPPPCGPCDDHHPWNLFRISGKKKKASRFKKYLDKVLDEDLRNLTAPASRGPHRQASNFLTKGWKKFITDELKTVQYAEMQAAKAQVLARQAASGGAATISEMSRLNKARRVLQERATVEMVRLHEEAMQRYKSFKPLMEEAKIGCVASDGGKGVRKLADTLAEAGIKPTKGARFMRIFGKVLRYAEVSAVVLGWILTATKAYGYQQHPAESLAEDMDIPVEAAQQAVDAAKENPPNLKKLASMVTTKVFRSGKKVDEATLKQFDYDQKRYTGLDWKLPAKNPDGSPSHVVRHCKDGTEIAYRIEELRLLNDGSYDVWYLTDDGKEGVFNLKDIGTPRPPTDQENEHK
ncbi:MAG: hypothetical protein K8T20_11845 [Planctomycetes bacterium]|nr:hypothetical protein [Planctomycetota bacterium]